MLPLHLAPSLLIAFMVILAVVPLGIIWWDERRQLRSASHLAKLRGDIGLREQLARLGGSESRRASVTLPGA